MKLSEVDNTIEEGLAIFDYFDAAKREGKATAAGQQEELKKFTEIAKGMAKMWARLSHNYVSVGKFKVESVESSAILSGILLTEAPITRQNNNVGKTVPTPRSSSSRTIAPKTTASAKVAQPNPQKTLNDATAKAEQEKEENLQKYITELAQWIGTAIRMRDKEPIMALLKNITNANPSDSATLVPIFVKSLQLAATTTDTLQGYDNTELGSDTGKVDQYALKYALTKMLGGNAKINQSDINAVIKLFGASRPGERIEDFAKRIRDSGVSDVLGIS